MALASRRLAAPASAARPCTAAGLLDQPVETIQARYRPRPPVPLKLEPYIPLIQARLTEFPALQATRLFAECRAAGTVIDTHEAIRLGAGADDAGVVAVGIAVTDSS